MWDSRLLPAPAPDPLSLTVTSVAAEDGHVLESAQNSGLGGTVDSASTTFRLGDDASNRAYRQFMSFDTSSLPDNARIYEVTIGITRIGNPTGNIPIGVANSQFGDLIVDLATPGFEATGLSANDWQSAATKLGVSKFAWPAYSNQMTIYSRLESSDNALVNLTGKTQFRVRYQNDDDNDGVADYMSYATGNHGTAAFRPTLTVKYYLDQGGIGPIVDSNILDDVVSENSPVGTTVGVTGYAVDPDVVDSVSYSLDDNAAGRFAIHPTSGVVTVAGVIDRETASSLSITIRATSSDASFVTTTRTIAISDVNEFGVTVPIDNDPTTNSVVEQAANGTAVGIAAVAADADATTNNVTFSLVNNAGGRFAIHPTSGVVTVANGSLLDLGPATSHEIMVRATSTDGSTADASFTINLQSANPIPGDYDSSGVVDNLDYDLWRNTFGSIADLRADGNQNGTVDAADYTVWQDNLGATF